MVTLIMLEDQVGALTEMHLELPTRMFFDVMLALPLERRKG